ncbi:dihydrolipoamide acetyltransferase family protein [Sedimentibacter sp.]|uniref:dihydrolipoamide acetyltransferase family protein n=1 Tax=Sedimentibacter sp. TaxID=1960295 RepID=UPI002898A561|nr:dihydrolipoamide acetyltransferase family protein [Sedimentibacter sp.]
MAREIVMPKLGLTMVEGTLTKWFVEEGNEIKAGDKLAEVETDKLTNEIIADTEGIMRKIIVQAGETVPVKALMGVIAGESEDISAIIGEHSDDKEEEKATEKADAPVEEVKKEKNIKENSGYILATPYAKKISSEKGIDLSEVDATGYNGVILAKDVEKYQDEMPRVKATPAAKKMASENNIDLSGIQKDERIRKADVEGYASRAKKTGYDQPTETEKAVGMRRIIAERMRANWVATPMVTFNMEVDMTEFIRLREKLKPSYAAEGLKLTYNHMLMKVLGKLLMKYRHLNASLEEDTITYHNYVNLGIAVDVEKGLMVPNVKGLESMTLREIAEETERLIEGARSNKLVPDDLSGGTFSITNIGMFGMDSFTPIINRPEVAILGINRIADKPVVVDKRIVVRPMMNLSLTTDHSLVDGALSAKFLSEIKQIIENPYLLID